MFGVEKRCAAYESFGCTWNGKPYRSLDSDCFEDGIIGRLDGDRSTKKQVKIIKPRAIVAPEIIPPINLNVVRLGCGCEVTWENDKVAKEVLCYPCKKRRYRQMKLVQVHEKITDVFRRLQVEYLYSE